MRRRNEVQSSAPDNSQRGGSLNPAPMGKWVRFYSIVGFSVQENVKQMLLSKRFF